MGITLNLYLNTEISLCLESMMMLTITKLTKIFTTGKN